MWIFLTWSSGLDCDTVRTSITKLHSTIRATWSAHLILLDFITHTILVEEYRTLNSTLCSVLHSTVTSSLLGTNILLNTLFPNIIIWINKWEKYVACIGETFIEHCYGKTKGNRLCKLSRHRSSDNINMDLNCGMVWIGLIWLKGGTTVLIP
jgi:hypothetical protein